MIEMSNAHDTLSGRVIDCSGRPSVCADAFCSERCGLFQSGNQLRSSSVRPQVISGDVTPPAPPANARRQQANTGIITAVLYQLQMPLGANSRDDAFWKLVEEDVVDVPTSIDAEQQRPAARSRRGWRIGRSS